MRAALLVLLPACSEYDIKPNHDEVGGLDTEVTAERCELVAEAGAAVVDDACRVEPETGGFNPQVEWQWSENTTYAGYHQIMSTPVVGVLDDDDGDGDADGDDIPDIVFTAFTGSAYSTTGTLTAIEGDGSGQRWSLYEVSGYHFYASGTPAIGDLDGDGHPEVCAPGVEAAVVCVHADGAFAMAGGTEIYAYGAPALHDLDGDGAVEVIFGRQVINNDGTVRWTGTGGAGHYLSFAVDIDGDDGLEVVAGNTLYDTDGTLLWTNSNVYDAIPAAGDFDLDGTPEIVGALSGQVYLLDADGTTLWTASFPSGGAGAPTVADFDGDGYPEVGVAGAYYYAVFETDGSLLWSTAVQDYSSSVTGSSVFDFEGDGAADVVYGDEVTLWVFDGATGAIKFAMDDHASGTLYEYPLVVDVDNDGVSEIVLASNNYTFSGWTGITVIGDIGASWRPSRPIWNQFAWYVTHVEDDGSIPADPEAPWADFNTFRAGGTDLGLGYALADISPGEPEVCTVECVDDLAWLVIPVQNTGTLDATDLLVEIRDVADAVVWSASLSLASGGSQDLGPLSIAKADWTGALRVVVDAGGVIEECDESDNTLPLGAWPCE